MWMPIKPSMVEVAISALTTIGIHPNDFHLNPNKIPTGGVVQNCLTLKMSSVSEVSPTDGNYPNTTSNSRKTVTSGSECYVIVNRWPLIRKSITSSSGSEES